VEIRKAVETDFEQLLPLLEELLRHPIDNLAEMKEVFDDSLNSDKRVIFVAESEGKVKGLLSLTVYKKNTFYTNCLKAEIDEFIVSSDERGGGGARSLMERAVQYTAERGCKFVELWTDLDNQRAHAFYEKLGFMKRGLFMQRTM